ncbi:Hypothetical predicted protein [Paramuricea clavata]|uniref:Uncharacterized protein n=1 Tax=Paramuricea clavata TaxID=317549 RepID=A0A6S7GCY9_PARCT|nr:Hypothetical predicted protein [Paramuricea clavata]
MTTVGGQQEEINTKLYNVPIRSLENNSVFTVNAVGIPCISDDITEVEVEELAKHLGLGKNVLYRRSGKLDMLIGIDHATMHTGEIKQVGNLVARHSPLGWLVFGATHSKPAADNKVLKRSQGWIRSESRAFKPFVSVRVGEIQNNSDPCQWRHIPGEINVADDVSRGIQVEQLEGRWQRGPDFLYLPESEWPHGTTDYKEKAKDVEVITSSEYRKAFAVNATTESTEKIIDYRNFSEWRKLIRVTAYVLRFLKSLKGKCEAKGKEESPIDTRCDALSSDELNGFWYTNLPTVLHTLHPPAIVP